MIEHNGNFFPWVTVGVPVCVAFVIAAIITIILIFKRTEDRTDAWIMSTLPILAVVGVFVGCFFGYYPFKADYLRLQPVSGRVLAVDDRFMAASQYIVITYDTKLTVRCDDARCATVKPGENLRLLCHKEHEWGSPLEADGWVCRWGSY